MQETIERTQAIDKPTPDAEQEPRHATKWWSFTEVVLDKRGLASTRNIAVDVTSIRSVAGVVDPATSFRRQSLLRVAGLRQPIRLDEAPHAVLARLERVEGSTVRLLGASS